MKEHELVTAGIVVDLLFATFGLIPTGPRPKNMANHASIIWSYMRWLDLVALIVGAGSFFLHLRNGGRSKKRAA